VRSVGSSAVLSCQQRQMNDAGPGPAEDHSRLPRCDDGWNPALSEDELAESATCGALAIRYVLSLSGSAPVGPRSAGRNEDPSSRPAPSALHRHAAYHEITDHRGDFSKGSLFYWCRTGVDRACRRPALVVTLSLGKTWYRCVDTVRGERWSYLPISLFVSPRAARLAILACCGVSRSAMVPGGRPSAGRPVDPAHR
jgi:hypothetical protein